jgi:hypothetical protein
MYISQYNSDTGKQKPKTEFQVYGPGKNVKWEEMMQIIRDGPTMINE